jgi:hypothetical protein
MRTKYTQATGKRNVSFIGFLLVGAAVVALLALPLSFDLGFDGETQFVDEAYAQGHQGSGSGHGGGGQGMGGDGKGAGGTGKGQQGGSGGKAIEDRIFRDSGKDVLSADDDSDRPEWAGGEKELNPHRGTSNPTPGINKGDDYGDLWVLVRNPVTGEPILVNGEYQVCVDAGCTDVILTVDGELPEGAVVAEVELGRANIVRSPDKVTQHALDEVLAKLTAATLVTVDDSGRLVIDGATVDSPLENLALYIALMTNDPQLDPVMDKLPGDTLDLAASLLAAGSDKTGTIGIDFVVYFNVITDIVENDEYYNFDAFDYNRDTTYSGDITYFVQDPVTLEVTSVTEPILQAVFDNVSYTSASGTGISDFTQAADDALQVIEFVHTQIHVEEPQI